MLEVRAKLTPILPQRPWTARFLPLLLPLLLLLTLAVAGCAERTVYRDWRAVLPPVPEGQSRLFFYRPNNPFALALQPPITLNDVRIGESVPGTVFFRDLPPGRYKVEVGERGTVAEVELRPNETRYLKTTPRVGLFVDQVDAALVDRHTAQEDMANLRLLPEPLDRVAAPPAEPAERQPRPSAEVAFECPAPGTTVVTSTGRLEFRSGKEFTCQFVAADGVERARFAAFWAADSRWAKERPKSITSLWPLKIGNRVQFLETQNGETRLYAYEVTGRETIEVPAGRFDTWVVRYSTRPLLAGDEATVGRLFWYAPEVGYFVRTRWEDVEAAPPGDPDWEAVAVETPPARVSSSVPAPPMARPGASPRANPSVRASASPPVSSSAESPETPAKR